MGRDEAITAIEPALAPSLERRIGNDHIAPENEVTRPPGLCGYPAPRSGSVRRASGFVQAGYSAKWGEALSSDYFCSLSGRLERQGANIWSHPLFSCFDGEEDLSRPVDQQPIGAAQVGHQ